jgi:Zn-dependent peptidase ImmA (M78 family)
MTDSDEDINERVERAVEAILAERKTGEPSNVAEKAREYRVSRYRIQRRLKGIGPRTSRKPVNKRLSEVQKRALLQYILTLDEIGQSIRYDYVSSIVNSMLKKDHQGSGSAPVID